MLILSSKTKPSGNFFKGIFYNYTTAKPDDAMYVFFKSLLIPTMYINDLFFINFIK